MDEQQPNSFWCLLPHEILCLIIQLIDFIDFHSMSAVCKNWKLACKHSSPPTPNDPIPWLLTKQTSLPTESNSMDIRHYIQIHRPLTNKTYNIDLPELSGTGRYCLHSKDAWLLIYNYDPIYNLQSTFLLLNLLTLDKICLPIPNLGTVFALISQGTFSTESKSPNCVFFLLSNIDTNTKVLYAWKIGRNDTWKTFHLSPDDCLCNTWLCDDYLYCFFSDRLMVFDDDLNLKTSKKFTTFWIDCIFSVTETNKELYTVAMNSTDSYKFDPSTLDWIKVNVRILIGFKRAFSCNIGFMVRDQWNEVYSQMKNLKNYGCQIRSKGEQVIINNDHMKQTWLQL